MPDSEKVNFHLEKVQDRLSSALNYWLYQSISSKSFLKNSAQKILLNTHTLLRCYEAFDALGTAINIAPEGYRTSRIPPQVYARNLALLYAKWEEIIPAADSSDTTKKQLHSGMSFDFWLQNGGKQDRFEPVRIIHDLLNKEEDSLFLHALLHGSLGTLDDTPGFSDMDLAFIIKSESLKDPYSLMKLRSKALQILTLTYKFDPYMHHGPYYLTEMDLKWYPEPAFPTVLFEHGMGLLDKKTDLLVTPRQGKEKTRDALQIFTNFFESRAKTPFIISDGFELEWVLGNLMILPALFLQLKTKEFMYKKGTFSEARPYFTAEEWEPVALASKLRSTLPQRFKPSSQNFWFSKLLRWPGYLQVIAIRNAKDRQRALAASKELGDDFPMRVLQFIQAIKNKC